MRTHQIFASVGAVALVASGLIVGGGMTAAAADAPANPTPSCVVSDTPDHLDCTVSYASTGAEQTFVVPAGVTSVEVELVGGRGGSAFGTSGGRGDRVTGSVEVAAGSTLYVNVAGNGTQNAGGYNGGGSPGAPSDRAFMAGGGGATDLRTLADLASRVAVAGGGGGAVSQYKGGDAEQPGNANPGLPENGGQPGTQTAGGAGGTPGPNLGLSSGAPGTLGFGGAGGDFVSPGNPTGGGGGGGGFYGGGGGLSNGYGSGGGGSSLVPAGGSRAPSDDAPVARLTYKVPIASIVASAPSAPALQPTTVSATAFASVEGHSAPVTSKIAAVSAVSALSAGGQPSDVTCATSCVSTRAGQYTLRATFGAWSSAIAEFPLEFTSLTQTIDFTGGSSDVQQPMQLVAAATSGLPVSYVLVSGPCTLNGSTLAATGTGTCTVTASQPGANPYLAGESVTRSFNATAPVVPPVAPSVVPPSGNPNSLANTGQAEGAGAMAAAAALALVVLGAGMILVRRKPGSAER